MNPLYKYYHVPAINVAMVTLQEPEYDAREQEAMQPEQEIEHLSATDAAATTQEVRRSILSARSARGGVGGGC